MPTNSIWIPLFTVLSPLTGKRCPRLVASPQHRTPPRPMSTDAFRLVRQRVPVVQKDGDPGEPDDDARGRAPR